MPMLMEAIRDRGFKECDAHTFAQGRQQGLAKGDAKIGLPAPVGATGRAVGAAPITHSA